ncbi:hypothetical protein SATMO3_29170 [Sporomusa aerivorans]
MKVVQPLRNCGNCRYLIYDRYEIPVCYQIEQREGKPVDVKRMRRNKACQSYMRIEEKAGA